MLDTGENDENTAVKRKKGVINAHLYKRNIIKKGRLTGKSYTNSVGKLIPDKLVATSCSCQINCLAQLQQQEKENSLQYFSSLKSKDEQDLFLQGLLECSESRRRKEINNKRPKLVSTKYYILSGTRRILVCKTGFLLVYGISKKRVERLLTLLRQNKIPHDMRGKSTSGNATPGLIVNVVATHIESFPTKQAHYATTDYKYLDSTLSIKLMYDLFKMKHPDYNISYKFYWSYFKENYNLRFGRLQTDTCVTCEQLGVKIKNNQLCDNVKRAAAVELMVHKRRSKKFYNAIKKPIPDDTIGLVIDFMANVSLPKIPVQDFYYYRQLTINTFGIHDLKTGRMVCYVYHEGDGGKGSNEVCTFIKMCIDRIDQNIKKLKIFADNWAGQNKNNAVVRFMMALVECKKFELVELFYPIRGHSFLPCDRDFSIIKRKLNKVSRPYTTNEYIQLIKSVSNNPEKFKVVEIGHEDIISFNNWWNLYYKRTCLSIESYGKEIERSQKQHFTVSMYHYMKCETRFSHSGL